MLAQRHAKAMLAVVEIHDALLGAQITEAPVPTVNEIGHGGFRAVQIVVAHAVDIGGKQEIIQNNDRDAIAVPLRQLQSKLVPGERHIRAEDQKAGDITHNISHLLPKGLTRVIIAHENAVAQRLGGGLHALHNDGIKGGFLSNADDLIDIDQEAKLLSVGERGFRGTVAHLFRRVENSFPGLLADTRFAVQRHGHRGCGDPQLFRDFFRGHLICHFHHILPTILQYNPEKVNCQNLT